METQSDAAVTRREVLVRSASGAVALAVVGTVAGCMTQEEKKPLITSGAVNIGPASDFPAGTASTRFVDIYGIVIVNSSGDPLAVHPKCTHKGCIAQWKEAHHEFVCPCHGSRYDLVGRVTKGPALRPLPAILAERQPDGTLMVNLTKLYAM